MVTLNSKNNRKEDKITLTPSISEPTTSEITGSWTHNKVEDYYDFWGNNPTLESTSNPSQVYNFFSSDSMSIDSYDYSWDLKAGAEITVGSNIYYITELYNNQMIFKEDYFSGYYLYYFTK